MKRIILLTLLLLGAQAYAEEPADKPAAASSSIILDKDTIYYPNANISSAVAKYKKGNYSGCLQELFSLTKKDPSNAMAYYYMAMAYTHVDMQAEAIEAYEKVIALNPNTYLSEYATKGKDCLTGGPTCMPETPEETTASSDEPQDELDKFINSSYGDGLSKDAESEMKLKELEKIKDTLNSKDKINKQDIEKIKEFDVKNEKSSIDEPEKIAMVSDEEILGAIKTLKDAGVNVSLQSNNPYAQMAQYQDPQMAQMSMLLGNNNSNSSMNMLPFLMSQADSGKNIDPRLMQALIMNSMVSDINFNNNNNDRY